MTNKACVCLWFDNDAEEAARFYTATFPDSEMGNTGRPAQPDEWCGQPFDRRTRPDRTRINRVGGAATNYAKEAVSSTATLSIGSQAVSRRQQARA